MKKIENCRDIFYTGIARMKSDGGEWQKFLDVCSGTYKYSFGNQVLIYVQNPNVSACAEYDVWNRCGRYVRRGARGIAVIKNAADGTRRTGYVFDISDTGGKNFSLWKAEVRDYRLLSGGGQFEEIVKESISEYADSRGDVKNREFIEKSAYYIVMKRTLEITYMADETVFEQAGLLSDEEIIRAGSIISDISENILRSIEKIILEAREHEREVLYERENDRQLHKRRDNLPQRGRLLYSGSRDAGGYEENRQIRNDAHGIHKEIPLSDVHTNDGGKHTDRLPDRNRAKSGEENGGNSEESADSAFTDSGQTGESDRIFKDFGEPESSGGGDSFRRDNIQRQLTFFPSESRQKELIESRDAAPLNILQEDIDAALIAAVRSENDVIRLLKTTPNREMRIQMLRKWIKATGSVIPDYGGARIYTGSGNIKLRWDAVYERIYSIYENKLHYDTAELDKDLKEENYRLTEEITGGMISAGQSLIYLSKAGFNTVTAEITDGKITISENYIKNGDLIRDPEITADIKDGSLIVRRYINDRLNEIETDGLDYLLYSYLKDVKGRGYELKYDEKDSNDNLDEESNAESNVYIGDAQKKEITDDIIKETILSGSGFAGGKTRIYSFFRENADKKERADFLKKEYGIGGESHNGFRVNYDSKGIHISIGNIMSPDDKRTLSWNKAEEITDKLILSGEYLTAEETAEYEKNNSGEKSFSQQVDEVMAGTLPFYTAVKVCDTPEILLNAGCEQLPMLYTQKHLKDALHEKSDKNIHWHGLDASQIKRLPELIESPMMIFDSPTRNDSIVIASDETDKDDLPLIISVKPNGKGRYELDEIDANFITSIYGRERFYEFIKKITEEDRLLYCNKEKSQGLFKRWGLQLPELINNLDYDIIIHQSRNIVNTKNENISEKDTGTGSSYSENTVTAETPADIIPEASGVISDPQTAPEKDENTHNFRITESANLTKSQQFKANMAAIRTLKRIESENRLAAPDEQTVLAGYAGWGGLSECFNEKHTGYGELKNLLSGEEYSSARESSLNAFYTPDNIIRTIYDALAGMGFKSGRILEPSAGTGRFFGMLPESMSESKLCGVELDSISGRIAKQLYQNADIQIKGFEETDFPDKYFDIAVGNVPFGNYSVNDSKYNKYHFMVHDYFIAKTIDKLRPGGVAAVVTSKGTMDKQSPSARQYFALKAELIGAVRLPAGAFSDTKAASDILFFRKRAELLSGSDYPDWVNVKENTDGFLINSYFADNPEMIMGELAEVSSAYGSDIIARLREGDDLNAMMAAAADRIAAKYKITEYIAEEEENRDEIPAPDGVRNYSFAVIDDEIYFRDGTSMRRTVCTENAAARIKEMCRVRDTLRELIDLQLDPDSDIKPVQERLNIYYDEFAEKYGRINETANKRAFSDDAGYPLLSSLEVYDEDGRFISKSDIFSKRTIRAKRNIEKADTSADALGISISEKGRVDIEYMMSLTGFSEEKITEDLRNIIYKNPEDKRYVTADEYLSGDIKNKIKAAEFYFNEDDINREINIEALKKVIPAPIKAADIEVRLGAVWIPEKYINQFIYELLKTPNYLRTSYNKNQIAAVFDRHTSAWSISNKTKDSNNINVGNKYGTERINAYAIIEQSLNLRDVKIYDYYEDDNGRKKAVLNKEETTNAQAKQEAIENEFSEWIWKDPVRRADIEEIYNDRFNRIRPREYDGSFIRFYGMSPDIVLRPHQINAVARGIYGKNTLLAHVVGAGKSYEMIAIAMEKKRLGMCSKSLFAVPNHLTGQMGADFLRLYPGANILVTTERDFEKNNRRRLCAKIAAGDYDAVIIGHSQLAKIPVSGERQIKMIENETERITEALSEAKAASDGRSFTVKQLETVRKRLEVKMQKLLNDSVKDKDNVTFEQLGVDALFIDEAHLFKNLYFQTKMSNISGIPNNDVQKTFDLMSKCQYIDEITGGRGIVFATGTPVSNSMTEIYTMQRYLQQDLLKKTGLENFDSWASTFGRTVTEMGLAPEGTGYRLKTRFAKFFNLPELMTMFRESADIQTSDMLNLPVPEVKYINETAEASEEQKEILSQLAKRAEKVRGKEVDSSVDNMLCITNDGRKMALDARLFDPALSDNPESKVNKCVNNVFKIWEKTAQERLTQLIFCDMSTPKKDEFNVYDDMREKLVGMGVPKEEIEFIHNADTETKKQALFAKVRKGEVRILIGSTAKMGAGTNIQDRLCALHHADCPWRPSDLEQREGRILRQGNMNDKVKIFRYVTKGTFDSYMWETVENKQRFISQIMTSKSPVRSADDIDESVLSYAEVKALAAGNPLIKEKMDLDNEVARLKIMRADYTRNICRYQDELFVKIPAGIKELENDIAAYKADYTVLKQYEDKEFNETPLELFGKVFTDKKQAGEAVITAVNSYTEKSCIGSYRGFDISVVSDNWGGSKLVLKNNASHAVSAGSDSIGMITRMNNVLNTVPVLIIEKEEKMRELNEKIKSIKNEINKPFEHEEKYRAKLARQKELMKLLDADNSTVRQEKNSERQKTDTDHINR